ncbi:carbonic anhydrase-like [Pollicipes pollicipes]|uniref:carbonic anhydrase-like n=1 Tax=Pollicipes pollicipes TaxID=41117 RepID=UPI0018855BA8|nr:carbonic anhydrase-like [Pollicipes pollicipes]XP_037085202.1 carbonic anhydrase-like [Pollicipes pollicipes]
MTSWGYSTKNGPDTWVSRFPLGGGQRQSPINIETATTLSDRAIDQQPLVIRYEPAAPQPLTNTGTGWRVDFDSGSSTISGGPLQGEYELAQYHCHWGRQNERGSEHTVDGRRYAAELHLVHFNKRYGSFAAAADKEDGLAVIGLLLEIGAENPELRKVTDSLSTIQFAGSSVRIAATDPDLFLPDTTRYWTYEGSLTTPPLYESVTWIVFSQPVTISQDQLDQFRHLKRRPCDSAPADDSDDDDGVIADNFRPPLQIGSRTVRSAALSLRTRH